MSITPTSLPRGLLTTLALGTFAIGTESFMLAGLLPRIASDLAVTVTQAGLLVTAFALTYAVGGPVLAIFTSGWPRRTVLVGGMAALLWAVSSAVGLALGGRATDRFGSFKVVAPALLLLAAAFYYLASMAGLGHWPLAALMPGVVLGGLSVWGFFPAQQNSLVHRSGVALAPVVLSLNASFQYAGFSLGALAGGFTVAHASAGHVGWVGGSFEVLALLLVVAIERRRVAAARTVAAGNRCAA